MQTRETGSSAFAATTALHGGRCGVGGRSGREDWRRLKALEVAGVSVRSGGDPIHHVSQDAQNKFGVECGVEHDAAGRCATLRYAATRPDARRHALGRSQHGADAAACGVAKSAAMRSALAPFLLLRRC